MPQSKKGHHSSNPRLVGLSRAGYRALEKRRLDEAARYFDQMLDIDPANTYALVGHAELDKHDIRSALKRYTDCLAVDPGNRFALKGAAECSWELREYRRSVELWTSYLKVTSPDATVLTHLADGYRKLEDGEKSEAAYRQALEIEPDNHYALNGLATLRFDSERYEQASALWEKLLQLDPGNVRVLVSLGNCHRKLRTSDKAPGLLQTRGRAREGQLLRPVRDCRLPAGSWRPRAVPGNMRVWMKGIMIAGLALILIAAVPFTVLGEPRGRGESHFGFTGFAVSNPSHSQALGGNSTHACKGLSVASGHSNSVHSATPPAPSGDTDGGLTGGSTGTVTSTGPGTLGS